MAKQMTPLESRIAPLLKLKAVRELILLGPTLSGRRTSNKTEDYGVFKPSRLSHLERVMIYVTDLRRSREWYERVLGATCTDQSGPLPHPTMPGQTIYTLTLSFPAQQGSIVLIQRVEANGAIVPVRGAHGVGAARRLGLSLPPDTLPTEAELRAALRPYALITAHTTTWGWTNAHQLPSRSSRSRSAE